MEALKENTGTSPGYIHKIQEGETFREATDALSRKVVDFQSFKTRRALEDVVKNAQRANKISDQIAVDNKDLRAKTLGDNIGGTFTPGTEEKAFNKDLLTIREDESPEAIEQKGINAAAAKVHEEVHHVLEEALGCNHKHDSNGNVIFVDFPASKSADKPVILTREQNEGLTQAITEELNPDVVGTAYKSEVAAERSRFGGKLQEVVTAVKNKDLKTVREVVENVYAKAA